MTRVVGSGISLMGEEIGATHVSRVIYLGVACDSCSQIVTPEQRRAKLADIAERLGVKDALDASSEIWQPHQELFNEPDYLEFQRQRALEADAG